MICEIRNFFQDKENDPCPLTEKLVKEGYQRTAGGYITIARRNGMIVDYRQNQPSQYWHLMNYCNDSDPNETFPRSVVCGELLFWMPEVSESITEDGLMYLMAMIFSSATDNVKGRPVYDRKKWNNEIHKLCFDAILNNDNHNGDRKYHDNPYVVVREKTVEDVMEEDSVRRVETIGYDTKGRVVSNTIKRYYPDGREDHSSQSVNVDGYWYGGYSDYLSDGTPAEGIFAIEKFDENA